MKIGRFSLSLFIQTLPWGVRTKTLLAIVRRLPASAKFAEILTTPFVGPAITTWCYSN